MAPTDMFNKDIFIALAAEISVNRWTRSHYRGHTLFEHLLGKADTPGEEANPENKHCKRVNI